MMGEIVALLDCERLPFVLAERVIDDVGRPIVFLTYYMEDFTNVIVWSDLDHTSGSADDAIAEWQAEGIRVVDHRNAGRC